MKIKTSVVALLLACVVSGLLTTGCDQASNTTTPPAMSTNAPAMTNMPPTNAPAK